MIYGIRITYLVVAWLFLLGVLTQALFAGLSLFADATNWANHIGLGWSLGYLALLLLLLALLGRLPRSAIGLAGLLFGLYLVQVFLPSFRSRIAVLAALHPLNAFFLFWVAQKVARRANVFVREARMNATGNQPTTVPAKQ